MGSILLPSKRVLILCGLSYFPAKTAKSGRPRVRIIGEMDGELVALVASPLGAEALAIVSLRPASKRERILHES